MEPLNIIQRLRPRALKAGVRRRWQRRGTRYDVYATFAAVERHANANLMTEAQLHESVAAAIRAGGPFLLGRPGSFEAKLVNEYLDLRQHRVRPLDYQQTWRRIGATGGFPLRSAEEIDRFAADYLHAVVQSDILVVWLRSTIGSGEIVRQCKSFVALGHIEPLAAQHGGVVPWTRALEGLKVLIVHPFRASILSQFARRTEVPAIARILPRCDIEVVVPPQTYAGFPEDPTKGWTEYLQRTREAIVSRRFDVAIVGAGPYGLPLAAFVKQLGKPAIHLGGATQLLFAVRGGRWEESELYRSMMDESWVRPLQEETPPLAATFEHGSPYW